MKKIKNGKKKTIQSLYDAVLSSDRTINQSLKVHNYDPTTGSKNYIVDLTPVNELALNKVPDHVLKVAKFLFDNQTHYRLNWYDFFEKEFPSNYNTVNVNVSFTNPLVRDFMVNRADWNKVKNSILNTLYLETDTGEPVKDFQQMLKVSTDDLLDGIKTPLSINVDHQTSYEAKQLYEIIRRINRLKDI
ncbi:hypothetical protein [Lactiplantibacillus plantarum]|uniref:hypothetical protein n=1 Tax=Lactiplantibacillus plantarum TaxID=1590 RepID=UPI001BAD6D0D|nr:hypothetical protein [Lactiplantibacillus plantarum]MBS0938111.1 hypothetical protein [Lactiplantibacillus plantarum]MBS0946071.1 hypothetical protein [Lactiplantibacillus plantarum]